jgi:hypothetical protein
MLNSVSSLAQTTSTINSNNNRLNAAAQPTPHAGFLSVTPTSLAFTAVAGGSNPATQSVTLTTSSAAGTNYNSSVTYNAGQPTGWLSYSPTAGIVLMGTSQTITIKATVGTLPAGTYNATITFTDALTPTDNASVSITFTIAGAPTLSISPSGLVFNAVAGGANPAPLTTNLSAANGANGTITYGSIMAYGGGQPTGWLSDSPNTATIANGSAQPISVMVNIAGLSMGTYNGTITFTDKAVPSDTVTLNVTLNVAAPTTTPIITTTTTLAPTTTTPIITTTTTPAPTTATTTTPAPTTTTITTRPRTTISRTTTSVNTGRISGQVLINGNGISAITLRLNGGNYQQTDADGNFSFADLAGGDYNLTVLVDSNIYSSNDGFSKATDVAGYVHPIIHLDTNQISASNNFNLQTNTPPTNVPTTVTTTRPIITPTTAPVTTTQGGGEPDFPGCPPPNPLPKVLSFNYCVTQSPTDPNTFNLSINLYNDTQENLDLSHTLILNLSQGATTRPKTVSNGNVTTSADGSQVIWSNIQLAPGQSASLSFYISKAAKSATLVQDIKVTGLKQALHSSFNTILPAILAKIGTGQEAIYPITDQSNPTGTQPTGQGGGDIVGLPATGQGESISGVAPILLILLLSLAALAVGSSLGLVWWRKSR